MATVRYTGAAPSVAMVQTITITAYDATTTYKVTINGKVVSVLGSGGTTTTVATALTAALVASTEPEFLEITWTSLTNVITGVAVTAGKPFIATTSVSGGAGTIGATTTTVANSGPNDVSLGQNYSTGSTPANTDDLYIDVVAPALKYNLQALSAITLNSLNVFQNFTSDIGLPKTNSDGSTSYPEYRQDYFQIGATTINIGNGNGTGSGRIKIDNGSVQTALNLNNSGQGSETGLEAILWKGTNASNVVSVNKGTLGIAPFPGELATVNALNVGFETSQSSDATVRVTQAVTLTTVDQSGGSLLIGCAGTTLNGKGGSTTVTGTGAWTTITLDAGHSLAYLSSGAITTLTVGVGCTADFSQDLRSKTITNKVSLYSGCTFSDPFGILTLSAGFQTVRCDLGDTSTNVGPNRSFTVT